MAMKSLSPRFADYRPARHSKQLLLAIFITLLLSFPQINFTTLAQGPTPTDDEVNRIAKQLYCPVCESTPLDVCPTEACRQWRGPVRPPIFKGKKRSGEKKN